MNNSHQKFFSLFLSSTVYGMIAQDENAYSLQRRCPDEKYRINNAGMHERGELQAIGILNLDMLLTSDGGGWMLLVYVKQKLHLLSYRNT